MDIASAIEKLQNKPKAVRKRILALTLIISMAIIGGIWLGTLNHYLQATDNQNDNAPKPFGMLWSGIKNTVSDAKTSAIQFWQTLQSNSSPQDSGVIYEKQP